VTTSSPGVIPLTRPASLRRFDKYILIRKLAEGGMAEIYLAKQVGAEGFERNVVIKCMLEHLSQSREFVSMFLDEARLAAQLHHPNIVQITDLGMADNRYFICMEYLAGEDLEALIAAAHYKGQSIPIPIAARIMLSAMEGLEFAHGYQEQGRPAELVHRDISPSNIFVTYQGTVKVLDFGIAKASSRMTQTQPGLLKGKWGYMSPEQARGEPIDARSDLFSVGVTFHELLTARRVFERDNEIGVLLAMMAQPIPPPSTHRPEVPPELDRIIMKALEKRREDRYASASEMRKELEEFLQGISSAPGVSQLSQYMQGLFGTADVERKTKIPSLSELGAHTLLMQDDPFGYEKTMVRPTDPGAAQAAAGGVALAAAAPAPAPAVPSPAPAPAPAHRSTGLVLALGALLAVVMLALGGGVVWYLMQRGAPPVATPTPTPPVVAQPVPPSPTPSPVVESPTPPALPEPPLPVATKEPVTPPVEPTPEEPATPPEDTPPETPKVPKPPKAISLTPKDIIGVLRKNDDQITKCSDKFLPDMPADRRVWVQLTIRNSGQVREVKVIEPIPESSGLAKCLVSTIRRMTFPRNNNKPELTLKQPLKFKDD
jgi:serine/threonine protein kinase